MGCAIIAETHQYMQLYKARIVQVAYVIHYAGTSALEHSFTRRAWDVPLLYKARIVQVAYMIQYAGTSAQEHSFTRRAWDMTH